ncbi:hypothetical protein DLAC_02253 [Tieghemostelium lacteum]|uniref:Single domain-containing protein n=1 Tax=Tieghemostelium lacteum TaxID=361077 RepID=A0A152A4Z0_TIELA|nr:hypothetical protein DLAC_02253 [Tieghemostelium lacteum]|eukprot:KYR01147.1 hypothetical protein DLAC_02253 [Tieghemostelium lacteum]
MKLNILVLIVLVLVFSIVYTQTTTPKCEGKEYNWDGTEIIKECKFNSVEENPLFVPGDPNLPFPYCCPKYKGNVDSD